MCVCVCVCVCVRAHGCMLVDDDGNLRLGNFLQDVLLKGQAESWRTWIVKARNRRSSSVSKVGVVHRKRWMDYERGGVKVELQRRWTRWRVRNEKRSTVGWEERPHLLAGDNNSLRLRAPPTDKAAVSPLPGCAHSYFPDPPARCPGDTCCGHAHFTGEESQLQRG